MNYIFNVYFLLHHLNNLKYKKRKYSDALEKMTDIAGQKVIDDIFIFIAEKTHVRTNWYAISIEKIWE